MPAKTEFNHGLKKLRENKIDRKEKDNEKNNKKN